MMRPSLLLLLMLSVVCTSGCSTVKKTGAAAALPFAALGDTIAVLPFQGCEQASSYLLFQGDSHLAMVREEQRGKPTLPLAEHSALVYYIPGYALWPPAQLAPAELFPMTKGCLAVFEPPKKDKPVEEPLPPSPEKKPVGEFEEW